MEESKNANLPAQAETPPPLAPLQRPSMQQRLRAETDDFDFAALLNDPEAPPPPAGGRRANRPPIPAAPSGPTPTSDLQATVPPEPSHRPWLPEPPLNSRRPYDTFSPEPAPGSDTDLPKTGAQSAGSGRGLWKLVGAGSVVVMSLAIVFAATQRQDAAGKKAEPNRVAADKETAAARQPSDDGEAVEGRNDAPSGKRASMQTGTMRLHISSTLTGPFSYWFVAATGQASPAQALRRQDVHGKVNLNIPAAYNHAGAQLRLLDQSLGKVARLPVTDFSHPDIIVDPQVGNNLLRDEKTTDPAKAWTLEKTAPAQGTLQERDALEGPLGTAGRVLLLEVGALGKQNWHVQCYQTGIDLQEGKTYQFSFWAKADRARKLSIGVILDRPDWHPLGPTSSVDLTTNWQKYVVPFTAQHVVPNHGRVSFILGDALGTVSLSSIALRRGSGRSVSRPRAPDGAVDLTLADFH